VVSGDEREETGFACRPQLWTTFAHAFETVGGYGAWLHGEAVAAGMVCASMLPSGWAEFLRKSTERQRRLLGPFNFRCGH